MARYGMVIDLKRCIGCHTCTIAYKVENSTGPGIFWCQVSDEEVGTYPLVSRHFLPRLCMHYQNPPCVEVCPVDCCVLDPEHEESREQLLEGGVSYTRVKPQPLPEYRRALPGETGVLGVLTLQPLA